jgi:hypothetical protein
MGLAVVFYSGLGDGSGLFPFDLAATTVILCVGEMNEGEPEIL